jgi:hypothetical protein
MVHLLRGRWYALFFCFYGLLMVGKSGEAQTLRRQPGEYAASQTLWGRPVSRHDVHFQIAFGLGGGPDSLGLFHAMEFGWTFGERGHTLGLIHAFIQNKDVLPDLGGPDLFGGWMLLYKIPVIYPELVYKVAVGLGGTHDQRDGITPHWGVGWIYGLDWHYPFYRNSGLTLSLTSLNAVVQGAYHLGLCLGLGYTFF